MATAGAFSWNSELPSGHSPFWIRDEALAGLGLHAGDAVSVDTHADPGDGDLVVVEAEIDGDSQRLARRYFSDGDHVRLEPVPGANGEPTPQPDQPDQRDQADPPDRSTAPLRLPADSVIVLGVIVARLRFEQDRQRAIEDPLG